jgi:hypothetical protein
VVKKQKRNRVVAAVVLLGVVCVGVGLVWGGAFSPETQAFSPHYYPYMGSESKIYAVSQTTSYSYTDQTLTSMDGVSVAAGSGVFTINVTLRNDYSNENPPPSSGMPVAPVEGTAYIRLKATLYSHDEEVAAVNLSPSHFACPADQTGLVLASVQTSSFQLKLATNQTDITGYCVSLEYLGDSIRS